MLGSSTPLKFDRSQSNRTVEAQVLCMHVLEIRQALATIF